MTRSYLDTTAIARREAAVASLSGLTGWLGDNGLAAARVLPGLLAEIDQHTAAVIDALTRDGRQVGPVALAGYAAGVRDGAAEQGWDVEDVDQVDWSCADWVIVRLVAICGVARAARFI